MSFDQEDEYRMIPPTESSYTRISYPSMQPQTTIAGTMSGGAVLCAGPCRTAWAPRKSAKEHGGVLNAIRDAGWREAFGTLWMCLDCMAKLLAEQHRTVTDLEYVLHDNKALRQRAEHKRDHFKGALEMLRDDAQRSLDNYSARENSGQFVGSPRYPISLARDLIRSINHILNKGSELN